ncbi:hypothetical protein CSOJ01_13516 [Colletotrichum sojae]|uniref:Uncharacterized protein n=1 Tax=Colletotrichum sojae TaxID=2175907 RepID=A0A8H6IS36_9PEZI|nr:hypothetical protein CSOJ01_13516 [Colletotrichum sojae]
MPIPTTLQVATATATAHGLPAGLMTMTPPGCRCSLLRVEPKLQGAEAGAEESSISWAGVLPPTELPAPAPTRHRTALHRTATASNTSGCLTLSRALFSGSLYSACLATSSIWFRGLACLLLRRRSKRKERRGGDDSSFAAGLASLPSAVGSALGCPGRETTQELVMMDQGYDRRRRAPTEERLLQDVIDGAHQLEIAHRTGDHNNNNNNNSHRRPAARPPMFAGGLPGSSGSPFPWRAHRYRPRCAEVPTLPRDATAVPLAAENIGVTLSEEQVGSATPCRPPRLLVDVLTLYSIRYYTIRSRLVCEGGRAELPKPGFPPNFFRVGIQSVGEGSSSETITPIIHVLLSYRSHCARVLRGLGVAEAASGRSEIATYRTTTAEKYTRACSEQKAAGVEAWLEETCLDATMPCGIRTPSWTKSLWSQPPATCKPTLRLIQEPWATAVETPVAGTGFDTAHFSLNLQMGGQAVNATSKIAVTFIVSKQSPDTDRVAFTPMGPTR